MVDVKLLKPVREVNVDDLPKFALTVDEDFYSVNPAAKDYIRHYKPDVDGDPILIEPIEGVFGQKPEEIDATYQIDLAKGKFVNIVVDAAPECEVDLNVVIEIIGNGGPNIFVPGDIVWANPNGDNNGGGIISQNGNVVLTLPGDSDFDGQFTTRDLIKIFSAGEYEDGIPRNSTWAEGDWNGDGDFDSSDLVEAFKVDWFEQGPRRPRAVAPVHHPSPTEGPTEKQRFAASVDAFFADRLRRQK